MRVARQLTRAAEFAALVCIGCTQEDDTVRGRGLAVASLSASAQARVYEAAARTAFDVGDPALSLLIDPRVLPRTTGLAPAGRISESLSAELLRGGVFKGNCEPALRGVRGNPRCAAGRPGYVLRFSPVFTTRGDSTQVYVYAQAYDTPGSKPSQTLRFERAYQVIRQGNDWRAVREGRVPKDVRGEPR
ncbi:MAG TPA: hypothetical protein VII52_15385 [Gemmatimonadaceae bacterium]